jgi:hypothetical protein
MVARLALLVSCLVLATSLVAVSDVSARGHCAAGKVGSQALARAESTILARRKSVLAVQPIHIAFKGGHEITDRVFVLVATPPLTASASGPMLVEVEGDLQEENGDDTFPAEGISTNATTTQLGNIELDICADRNRPEHVQPGRYTGAITLRGSNFVSTTLAIDITVQGSQWWAIGLLLFGVVLGVALKLLPNLLPDDAAMTGSAADPQRRRAFLVGSSAIVILAGVSAVASYYLLYASNATWGASPQDKLKLILAGVTLQVTGMTTADIIGDVASRSRRSERGRSNSSG